MQVWAGYHPSRDTSTCLIQYWPKQQCFWRKKKGQKLGYLEKICSFHSPCAPHTLLSLQTKHNGSILEDEKRNVWFCTNVLGLCINLIPLEGKGSADPAAAPHLAGSPCPTAFSLLLPSHQHGHDQCNKEGGEGAMIYLEDLLKYLKWHEREQGESTFLLRERSCRETASYWRNSLEYIWRWYVLWREKQTNKKTRETDSLEKVLNVAGHW